MSYSGLISKITEQDFERNKKMSTSSFKIRTVGIQLFIAAALSVFSAIAFAHEYAAGEIKIDHPWARPSRIATIPAAVYFDILNNGNEQDRLVAATTERAAHVELHVTEMNEDGIAKMRHLKEGIVAPADSRTSMETGAYHVMLIDLKGALVEGERFPMTLTFEKAGEVEVIINVEDREAKTSEHHMDH